MFTSKLQLVRKSGKKGVDRVEFLQELINEFHNSTSLENQEQVLANLANFAYDPLNYQYLRELKVVELFTNALSSRNPYFVLYSLKGISNLVNDPLNLEIILKFSCVSKIKDFVKSNNLNLVKESLTILIFILKFHPEIAADQELVEQVKTYNIRKCGDQSLQNLAHILLEELEKFQQLS